MAKVAGTCYFKVNGKQYSLRGDLEISLGNRVRESVVGLDSYHGIKETPAASSIKGKFTDKADVDINDLQNLTDVTVTAELINGKVAVLRNATQMEDIALNAEDGSFEMRFEGPLGEWQAP